MNFLYHWSVDSARPQSGGVSGLRTPYGLVPMPSASRPAWMSRGSSFRLGNTLPSLISDFPSPTVRFLTTAPKFPRHLTFVLLFTSRRFLTRYWSRISGRWSFHSGGERRRTSYIPKAELSGQRSGISFAVPEQSALESWRWSTISPSPSPPPRVGPALTISGSRFAKSLVCVSLRTVVLWSAGSRLNGTSLTSRLISSGCPAP